MTIKTARISFFVEYDDASPHGPPDLSFLTVENSQGAPMVVMDVDYARLIGEPVIDHHDHPITSVSHDEMLDAYATAMVYGGDFAKTVMHAIQRADSDNKRKLTDEFWNLINTFRSPE